MQGIEKVQITVLAHDICSGSEIHWSKTSQFTDLIPITIKLARSDISKTADIRLIRIWNS